MDDTQNNGTTRVLFLEDQYEAVLSTVQVLRDRERVPELPEAVAIAHICKEYIRDRRLPLQASEAMRAKPGNCDDEEVPEAVEALVSKQGDLWILGRHRLLCGDSTSKNDMNRLCPEPVDMVFTDPPYNVNYDPEERPGGGMGADRLANPLGKIKNDKMTPEKFRAFLDAVYSAIDSVLKLGRPIYICHADTEGHHFRNAFIAQPWKLQACLIWKKSSLVFGRADYHWIHEPILYGWKAGEAHVWAGDRKQTTVLEVPTEHMDKTGDTAGKYVHPTQKPVKLILRALENSSHPGDVVLDAFGGSGSTMIACEKMDRSARLSELDPRFIDVIVRRWERFTGQQATLESDGRTFAEVELERTGP